MLTSKTYIVTWDEMLDNGIDVDKQLSESGIDYLVFDVSTDPQPRPNWVAAEKVRYYGHFYNSLVDFAKTSHDVFIFNAGDAISDNHPEFVRRIEKMMGQDPDVWMMAPRMVNDGGDGTTTLIQMSKKYEDIALISHINGIYVSLRRELALFILEYFEWLLKHGYMNFSTMITGHCLDTVYAAWTIYNNKKIYRDWVFTMETTKTTSYNTRTASQECNNIKRRFEEFIARKGGNNSTVRRIYEAITENETVYRGGTYEIEKIYQLLTNEKDLDY